MCKTGTFFPEIKRKKKNTRDKAWKKKPTPIKMRQKKQLVEKSTNRNLQQASIVKEIKQKSANESVLLTRLFNFHKKRLNNTLKNNGLRYCVVPPDGNCFINVNLLLNKWFYGISGLA